MTFPTLTSKFILAPMAEINDVAFRLLCKHYGCALSTTEMISSPAIARHNASTMKLIDTCDEERPFCIQLFGQQKETIVKAALFVEEKYQPNIIDFNMGCPARKIIKQGSGCALLLRKNRIKEIVSTCVNELKTPFTVKIRSGMEPKNIVALEIAKICEEAGASAITIHPRTMIQAYSGKADWSIIKQIKENVSIPIIGNGDVAAPEDAKRMFDETGCDYIMIGRAVMKNPYIFKQMDDYFKTGRYKPIDDSIRKELIRRYLELAEKHNIDFFSIKVHIQHFTAGMKGGAKLRDALTHAKEMNELLIALNSYL